MIRCVCKCRIHSPRKRSQHNMAQHHRMVLLTRFGLICLGGKHLLTLCNPEMRDLRSVSKSGRHLVGDCVQLPPTLGSFGCQW